MAIAICGMSPDREIPKGFELWGMPWDSEWTRMDVLFDMHDPALMPEKHKERLEDCFVPLYMQKVYHPNVTAYPLREVIDIVGDYFHCTIAYMIAFAIFKKVHDVVLVGVTGSEDYSSQRASIEYMIGVARGRGISVHVLGETDLFSGERYGFL